MPTGEYFGLICFLFFQDAVSENLDPKNRFFLVRSSFSRIGGFYSSGIDFVIALFG